MSDRHIGNRVKEILAEAIDRVSSGGTMKFDLRSLFYAVRELYLKRFVGKPFYKDESRYQNFSDFIRRYERDVGKIPGLVRGPRGRYMAPEYDGEIDSQVREGVELDIGSANKVLFVEKEGLAEMMIANKFHHRLDCAIIQTQGFSTEMGRAMIIQAEGQGHTVCVLHDFDLSGVMIRECLTRPTNRVDIHLAKEPVDIGLNWEIVDEMVKAGRITPEPVNLVDRCGEPAKLDDLLARGEITQGAHDFLQTGRVELNALGPAGLLEWLEKRLEELGLWKTVPEDQGELDAWVRKAAERGLEEVKKELSQEIFSDVLNSLGLIDVWNFLMELVKQIDMSSDVNMGLVLTDIKVPDLEDFVDTMRANMEKYWTDLAEGIGQDEAERLGDEVDKGGVAGDVVEDDNVIKARGDAVMAMRNLR